VDVELSRDNGGSWTTLATDVPNTGSLAWTVSGPPTTTARLRVTARDAEGNQGTDASNAPWTIQSAVAVEEGPAITEFALLGSVPNPARDQAVIEYAVPRTSEVTVILHDLQGRVVAVLASGPHEPGVHHVTWSGEVDGGRARAGVYFLQLRSPGVTKTRRIVVAH
jgi:flagellar hook capping protein FlgD